MSEHAKAPAVELIDAHLHFGDRVIFDRLNLTIEPGEFVAVLGPNGAGKTTLLKVLLGMQKLTSGEARIAGHGVSTKEHDVSVIPQQRPIPEGTPLRGWDMVAQGLDGERWGPRLFDPRRRRLKKRVDELIERVDATSYAMRPVWQLSGGEQQRLRAAQALASNPALLLCDEPLLSLDVARQQEVTKLIAEQARVEDSAVIFVTHEINPILPYVDRVLYLVEGQHRIGAPEDVINTHTLSELFGRRIDVVRLGGRVAILGSEDHAHHDHAHDHDGYGEEVRRGA